MHVQRTETANKTQKVNRIPKSRHSKKDISVDLSLCTPNLSKLHPLDVKLPSNRQPKRQKRRRGRHRKDEEDDDDDDDDFSFSPQPQEPEPLQQRDEDLLLDQNYSDDLLEFEQCCQQYFENLERTQKKFAKLQKKPGKKKTNDRRRYSATTDGDEYLPGADDDNEDGNSNSSEGDEGYAMEADNCFERILRKTTSSGTTMPVFNIISRRPKVRSPFYLELNYFSFKPLLQLSIISIVKKYKTTTKSASKQ
jgi:hypothetical protein